MSKLLKNNTAAHVGARVEAERNFDPLLLRMARSEIGERLQARLSAAEFAQQTFRSAIRSLEEFHGENHQQFAAWLCGIHERNLQDAIRRHVRAGTRAVSAQEGFSSDHDEALMSGHPVGGPSLANRPEHFCRPSPHFRKIGPTPFAFDSPSTPRTADSP